MLWRDRKWKPGMLVRRDRPATAIAIMLDVAFHAPHAELVSAADIAARLVQARRGIEPVLQALVRAGLLDSVRGPRGGYRLARSGRALPLLMVVAAVQEPDMMADATGPMDAAVIRPLWAEMERACGTCLQALTIDDLVHRAAALGIPKPAAGPLDFVI